MSYLSNSFVGLYSPFRSQNVVNLHTSRNVNKTRTIVNFDPVVAQHVKNISAS